ncbi:HepT-like ribonuclease domain-containing protein [Nitrospirillum viridazoti]|uniref:DUF86 domain-containing protein n=2 Tax=Nitrospirillum TaxID=1543705 RepID=A0A248JUA0_9PROT|nr:HepT-like ribonuclease domain-containing protein [Nitrospirillum amazonense]ASG21678.1 hypothetical protein Y958_13355 [Nitrospirillum amazonense CBAmc]TWB42161.1 uncharacterized protein with HEPN domain [Nitrospirillum amazonense]TWB54560.1 uncharacterized protein with HEPN domain [Nitrospirillum amazonense]
MMRRSVILRLGDLREILDGISGITAGTAYPEFAESWGLQRAVERSLEMVSAAVRQLPPDVKAAEPDIPWRQIAAMGQLLHPPDRRVATRVLWNSVLEHLPPLSDAIDRLIVREESR